MGLNYFEETQEAYTDNNGFRIAEQTSAVGSLSFGPTVSYTMTGDEGQTIKPLVGLKGVWDFEAPDIVDVNGLAVGTEGLRAQAKVGLSITSAGGTTVQGSYTYDGIGVSDFESHTGELTMSVPISLPGMPKGATLQGSYSLQGSDLFNSLGSGTGDDVHSGKISVTVPLD